MNESLRDDVGVEAVAKIDGIDIVAFQIRVPVGRRGVVSVCCVPLSPPSRLPSLNVSCSRP